MTEETKQSLAAKELDNESKKQDKGAVEHKSLTESPEHFQNVSLEPQAVNNIAKFAEKERDNTQQREAVIRPQQAGKIDFKSLQNHSFNSNRTWPSSKDSPQSPSGKSRNRDKSRKSGKERGNPQQLYRLSITNPRSNPTIGIAYPQQKVSPPKKLESNRGPVSGSYRFHVPSIPEREAELQQEELQFRCFHEGSPNLTSQSYTSQAVGATSGGPAHQNPPSTPQKKPSPIESNSTQPANETLFPDFQLSETDTWQSPDRTFRNTSFGLTSQKPNNLVDLNKTNGSFMPMPFQYGYPLLEESASDSFPSDRNTQSQDYIDISLTPNQVSHNSFSFPSSSEGHEAMQTSAQFGNDQVEDRQSYQLHPKPPQYMQTPHGMSSSVPSNDESTASSTHQTEQSKSVPDKSESFSPIDSRDTGFAVVGKRGCHLKNGTTSQRVLIQGSVHHIRNIAQGSSSQIHVISPPHNGIHISPGPLDKSASKHHGRVSHPWEGPNKNFPPPLIDQTSTPYPFQYQPAPEQRQNTGINGCMPWQQIRFTTAMPNQNRIDLSRQLSNQQLTFLIGPSDWQDESKPHKNSNHKDSNNFLNKKRNESFSNQKQDSVKQGCNTIPPCHFTNKVDTNQLQVGDAKNKSLYFGINHPVPVTSRNCSYPPLHVAPLGLKMVSPYDSPSHSPTQNPASSSTCSSLSPASTNSVNSNSDDSQISKVLSPQFYQQQQDKILISSNSMNTNQHLYHSEASRGLHYKQERAKENTASFVPHNRHSKSNMDNGKGCLETYRTENHPPPPYSAHQLATSLVSANLDQLDVLLTCKQCDQNFNNLVSFLDHKQYCGQHTFAQNDLKDVPKVEDIRKFQTDHTKAMSSGSSYAILRSSSDLHLSLLGLNKNGEIVPDNETKGDIKDDSMKLMLPSAPLPDLEMEDPKLDSLITEALNGLGYQSDNAEIDSSFIDAFVDDDLTTTKCTTRQTLTTKDSTIFEGRTNNESTSSERSQAHCKYPFDSDLDSLSSDSKHTDSPYKESQHKLIQKEGLKAESSPTESQAQESNCTQIEWEAKKSEQTEHENDYSSKFLLSSKFSARCGLKSLQSSTALVKTTCPRSTCANKSPTAQKPISTEGKRKRTGGGSWSKELIHKIVQQKNKLHKLHVKGTKNMQFSLVMERVTPAVQNPTFGEYDYVSDSDDDCEPVKIASQGRLSQSIRCKYTYTKECKGRIRADKSRESSWKQNKNECFDPKKDLDVSSSLMKDNPGHQRLRRRSSRSSTSSELSTSISICSDSISSPKSIDHTDSDSEKRTEVQRKDQDSLEQNVYEESPPRIRKESSTSLALTFTKNTKRYSTDKILLTEHKDRFTTSKCSSIICKTEETASERTMTKSTVSLARFKTTRVEIEEKGDHYGFEAGILATTEEPFKKDYTKNITSPRGSGITLNPVETTNNRDSNHVFTLKKDAVASKGKSHKRTNSSEFSAPIFEKVSNNKTSSEEANRSSNYLFPEPPPFCTSLVDKVCLSPSKVHDAAAQKDVQCLIPYPSEHDQSLIKSPLSFDTTSMFGDLSVGGFENNLYPDIHLAKESFSPLETTTDKKELFESSFSPFLEQRDWNLMVDVSPVLPDEISQYKEDPDSNENKTNFNHVPFALSEKLIDYTPNLNNVSVDDLEIKRIVTELESQLQTAKLSSPPPLDSELPKQLTMSKFSPLRLDPESEDEDSSLQINCSSENLEIARPIDSHSALFSEPDLPWSSPLPFGLMCGQQGLHTPTHSSTINTPTDSGHEHLDIKCGMGLTDLNTNSSPLRLEDKTENNECLDKSEEMLEHEIYTENLMKSLEVISDSLSSGFTSPQSSPNQECVVPEEHEKQDNEHLEHIKSEHVEFRKTETELTKFPVETNTFSDKLEEKTCDMSENETKTSLNETSNETLHNKELVANEQKLAESSFKSPQTACCVNSNDIDLENSSAYRYEHKHESSVSQTENAECDTQFDVKDSMYTMQSPDFSKISHFSTSPAIPKDKNTLFIEKTQKCDGDSALIAKPEIISEGNRLASDKTGGTTDCPSDTNIQPPLSNIKSPLCQDNLSTHSQLNNTLTHTNTHVSPKHLPVVQDEHDCTDSVETAMPDMTFSVQSKCEENQQKNIEQSPQLYTVTQAPQFSHNSIQSPCELRDNGTLPGTVTPALSKNRQVLEDKNSDHINIGRSVDTSDSATPELDNSFVPHQDLVKITESNISSSGTLLAMEDSISNQTFGETSQHSGALDGTQDTGALYDSKLSPLNYSETCFNDYNFTSKCFNKVNDQSDVKSNSTDNYILNACAFSLDKPLSSSLPYNANEPEPNIQGHMTGLDIPENSINDNIQNDIKFSNVSASCSNYIEDVITIDSEQVSKLNQSDMNGSHIPHETVDYMDQQLTLLKKVDSEKMDNQMITCEQDAMQSSTMLDVKETSKHLIPCEKAVSMGLACTSVQNEGQSLKSSETKSSPKKSGTQNAIQGKFQCEICAMFFRTQPGLKRHKAMKHVVKTEGISHTENVNMSGQVFMPIYNTTDPTEKALKDSMDVMGLSVLSHSNRSEISDGQGQQADAHLIFKGIASDSDMSKIPESCDTNQKTLVNEKPNNSINTINISSVIFAPELVKQDTISDEILSTLKTDILQALSPDSPSMVQQNSPKSPEKHIPSSSHSYHEVTVREEQKSMATISTEEQKEETTSTEPYILHKKSDTYDIDDVVNYCDINPKYVQTEDIHYPLGDSTVDIKRESTCSPTEDSHMLTGTLGIGPDLKAFFDDESTFSELFPRNDDRKRKKCARVYGKSNKKQKQLSCLVLEYPPTGAFIDKYEKSKENQLGHMFTNGTNDPCEYETISIDNDKMHATTPKSLVKSSIENPCHSKDDLMDHQSGYEESVETGIKEFLCENKGTIRQSLEHQDDSHDCTFAENIVSSVPQEDCKPEVPATACPLRLVCVQENASCSPSTEMPLVATIASAELKDPVRPCKKPRERKCRKRIEPGLKPKDKQYKCKVCFTWFLTLGELDFHKLSHNPSPPPTCYMCVQRKFSSREQLRDHLREKHAKNKAGVWTCGMCLKEISDVWMYNEHLREHATQFARRGQSQSSLLDMPGCFMQENAVKNFISSIMQHRPSRPVRDYVKPSSKEERRTSFDVNGQEPKVPEEFDSTSPKTKTSIGGGSKHCALEVLPKAETSSKNVDMHPNCKDPSRDCHHCGKQFPKPFKLQRHLVVHSLQKIFLCHKCPVSYQEAKDFKDHLKNEHEETDEPDSKHTTLYTCELCADVMHVIKKSFICSTCNYTFSKKEQFDRHMEKHLAGGNKIFKFRGVVRPCKPFNSKDEKSDTPPSKKRKATESSLDITASHMQGIKSVLPNIDDTVQNSTEEHSTETNNTSVKIEDEAEDFPEVARDIIECTVQTDSVEQSLPSTELKEENESSSPSYGIQADELMEVTDKGALTEICEVKIEDDCCTIPTTLLVSEIDISSITKHNEDRVETNSSVSLENASEQEEIRYSSQCTIQLCGQTDISLPKQGMQGMQGLSSCNDSELSSVKQSSNETSYLKQDQTTEALFSIKTNENKQDVHTHNSEQLTTALAKQVTMVTSEETIKQSLENNLRCLSTTDLARHTNSSNTCEDKDSTKQQKRKKDLKTPHSSQRTQSPTARENLGIDPRAKKKFRPSRCENIDGPRKNELPNDYPVLTSVKDDTVSNKIISKHKIGSSNLGLPLKKGSVDSFSPKKVEIVRHFTGDCKGKKSIPRGPIHSPSSRISTLNNSFNKSRSKPGVRSIETHSYRTAESQNNLLSQLFGQRLTSFKIPLRKDTSESIKD